MKRFFAFVAIAAAFGFASCNPQKGPDEPEVKLFDVTVQLAVDGTPFAVEGITVDVADAAGTATYAPVTDASGKVALTLPVGSYTATATYKTSENGVKTLFSGSTSSILIIESASSYDFTLPLTKVESQQIIIKEVYATGCPAADGSAGNSDDAYVVIYNNSDVEADASQIVFGFCAPYNANGTNKYYTGDNLLYENENWIPAYNAIWWFTSNVTIAPYSQKVIAVFGAVDFTATNPNSVDLSNPEYYWMSNNEISQYSNKKYQVAEGIPATNYLTAVPFNTGNAWALSNSAPAFFIGKMEAATVKAMCEDADNYDRTLGDKPAFYVVKFPKANVVDAVDIWSEANVAKSQVRFSADINSGYIALTNKLGNTIYRNVDAEATKALPENEGKIVEGYADDPSGIDAEASIKAGAHIIYSDTNNSATDFHVRKVASIK